MRELAAMRLSAVVTAVVMALLVGCNGESDDGGSDRPPSDSSQALSESEYVERLDEICESANKLREEFNRRAESLQQRVQSASEAFEGVEDVLNDGIPRQEDLIDQVAALDPPASEADFHENVLEYQNELMTLIRRTREAAERRDAETMRVLFEERRRIQDRGAGLIQGHGGFEHCGDETE
jgi:hypothetical protein